MAAVLGLIIGVVIGVFVKPDIPIIVQPYLPIRWSLLLTPCWVPREPISSAASPTACL